MKIVRAIAATIAMTAVTATAHASLFTFSYLFNDSTGVTGTFDGTASGNYVTNVSNVNLNINGTATGPTDIFSFWAYAGTKGEPYQISFDASENNFWFIDASSLDANGNLINNGNYGFALIGSAVTTQYTQIYGNNLAWYLNQPTTSANGVFESVNASWSLQEVVPEPATVTLLGLGLVGLGASRRHQRKSQTV